VPGESDEKLEKHRNSLHRRKRAVSDAGELTDGHRRTQGEIRMKGLARAAAVGLCAALLCSVADAAEFTRQVTVARVAMTSVSRPAYPGAQSIFRVYSTSAGSWGNSDCRADAADLSLDDWHMYGLLMRAWKDSIQVNITVESSIKIDTTDTVCKIVAVLVL
jgi:hypothetical protein